MHAGLLELAAGTGSQHQAEVDRERHAFRYKDAQDLVGFRGRGTVRHSVWIIGGWRCRYPETQRQRLASFGASWIDRGVKANMIGAPRTCCRQGARFEPCRRGGDKYAVK